MSEGVPLRKVVVWDLDNTLWEGVLLEGGGAELREGAAEVVRALDGRGILQSIASRNEPGPALARLDALGLGGFFLAPQIHFGDKSTSLATIGEALGLPASAFVLVDDQPFERDEVRHVSPEVMTLAADDLRAILGLPELSPREVTADAQKRRPMYQAELVRREAEANFGGAPAEFLEALGLRLTVAIAREEDLARAEELTLRTHQLNTTGKSHSRAELASRLMRPEHDVWVARLEDRYGDYGTIGLALVERSGGEDVYTQDKKCVHTPGGEPGDQGERAHRIELFLLSCRVLSRGIGAPFLHVLADEARRSRAKLFARFVPNEVNRQMRVAYGLFGFRGVAGGDATLLALDFERMAPRARHVAVRVVERGAIVEGAR